MHYLSIMFGKWLIGKFSKGFFAPQNSIIDPFYVENTIIEHEKDLHELTPVKH